MNCAAGGYVSNQPKSGSTIGCSLIVIDIERTLGGRGNVSTSTSPLPDNADCGSVYVSLDGYDDMIEAREGYR